MEKAGAMLYFMDPDQRSSTIGVVVNPVKIDSLADFATLDEIALKLITAERNKVTTNNIFFFFVGIIIQKV